MENYSAIKKTEILPFAATWMNLNGTMLSEISKTEKDKYHMISLICENLKKKFHSYKHSRIVVTRGRWQDAGQRIQACHYTMNKL